MSILVSATAVAGLVANVVLSYFMHTSTARIAKVEDDLQKAYADVITLKNDVVELKANTKTTPQ
jgi:hypothetical protein